MFKLFKILVVFFFSNVCYSKSSNDSLFIKSFLYNVRLLNENNIIKTTKFYFDKNWDSTLVHTGKILNKKNKNNRKNEYYIFLRGLSFFEKNLYKESKKNLLLLKKSFLYYKRVQYSLGLIAIEQYQFKKANEYLEPLLNINQNNIYGIDKYKVLINIGISYLHLKDYYKSEKLFLQTKNIYEEKKDTIKGISKNSFFYLSNNFLVFFKINIQFLFYAIFLNYF